MVRLAKWGMEHLPPLSLSLLFLPNRQVRSSQVSLSVCISVGTCGFLFFFPPTLVRLLDLIDWYSGWGWGERGVQGIRGIGTG